MNIPKPIAALLILGMLIQTAVPPLAPHASSSMTPPSKESPAGRPSLPTVSQESESIDSFTVHPANRWSEVETGTGYLDSIENGEFMFNTNSNDSSSMHRYRNAETTSGDIETRWRLDWVENTTNGDDWETPLMGLNVTTAEGDGNATLNAYPWNNTHYTLRPTFTTGDGTYWRSWNLESDYQDYPQMNGSWGADGWDFIEETDDGITTYIQCTDVQALGSNRVNPDAATRTSMRFHWSNLGLTASDWDYVTIRLRANVTDLNMVCFDTGFNILGSVELITDTNWNEYEFDLGNDVDWTGTEPELIFSWDEQGGDGLIESDNYVWIDWVRLTTTNDSSDLTFYEYQEYYRAKLAYNLLISEFLLKTETDSGSKINSIKQGTWAIADYFDADELIPDINLGTVGAITYLFGLRSAGANATCWWDFYAADFQEFAWREDDTIENNDSWDFISPFIAMNNFPGAANEDVFTDFNLTVPDFDSTSAKLSFTRNNSQLAIVLLFVVYSVDFSTGATTERLSIGLAHTFASPTRTAHADLEVNNSDISAADPEISPLYLLESDSSNYTGELTFSIHFDKLARQLSFEVGLNNYSGYSRVLGASTSIGDDSNEFVLEIVHYAEGTADAGETHTSMTDWDLVFRDIFGFPLPLFGIDDAVGATDPVGFLLQAFGNLAGIMFAVLVELVAIGSSLTTMVANMGELLLDMDQLLLDTTALVTDIGGILSDTSGILVDMGLVVTDVGLMLTRLNGILADTAALVIDIASIASDLGNLPTDFVQLLSDTSQLLSDVNDIIDGLIDGLGDPFLESIITVLGTIGTLVVNAIVATAQTLMNAIMAAVEFFFESITVNGVSIADLITVVDEWMSNFFSVAAPMLDLSIDILQNWTMVSLMLVLVGIMMWAAATSGGNGALFLEKFSGAMLKNANPVDFIFNIYIPVGAILIGNALWVLLVSFDWNDFLVPALMVVGL